MDVWQQSSAGCSSQEDFCRSFWTDRAARTSEFSIGNDGCWRSEFKTLGRTQLSMRVRVLIHVEWIVIEAEPFLAAYRFLCGPPASVWSVRCPCISQSQRRVVVGVVSFHYGKHHQFCPSHLIILGRILSWEGYMLSAGECCQGHFGVVNRHKCVSTGLGTELGLLLICAMDCKPA